MATVQVTGNAWDHTGSPIPAELHPQLWFRPERHDVSGANLLAGVEAQATLDTATGAFNVDLVAEPWIRYKSVLRWLLNPHEPNMQMWAWGYAEWSWTFNPYPGGGPISELGVPDLSIHNVFVSLNTPPAGYKGWWLYSPADGQTMPLNDPDIGDLRRVN
ncbi:hypothetical protein [Microbacterium aerolatum]|uniref:hypothetical protein n=1 Tax=Microbacterium aerolatum TaxID=153731 RepID=UPI00384E91C1